MWSYSSGWVSSGTSFPTHGWRKKKKDLQDINFSTFSAFIWSPHTSSQTNRIKESDHVLNGHRPNLSNKTLVIFASKETKAVLDGTMYPQQRRSKRRKKKKKECMGRNICAILHCCCLQPRVEITCTPRSITLWITPPQRWSIFSNLNQSS